MTGDPWISNLQSLASRRSISSAGVCLAATLLVVSSIHDLTAQSDWPQFQGPTRNGVYPGKDLVETWPNGGPITVWKKPIGQGFSGPVCADQKLILFHRQANREIIQCLDATTGKEIWNTGTPTNYRDSFGFDEGPRSTPSISGNKVYTLGASGIITCTDFQTGSRQWQLNAAEKFKAEKGFFGFACSPLVVDGLVLLNIGGRNNTGIIALEAETGKLRWKATNHDAGYSSPILSVHDNQRLGLFFTKKGLVGIGLKDGNVLQEFSWKSRNNASVNAATPLLIGNSVFLSSSYQTGAVLLDLGTMPWKKIWNGDDSISNHYATCVYRNGFLYGIHGRQEYRPSLRCLDAKTGKVQWSKDGFGSGTLTLAGSDLLIMKETGELYQVEAAPTKYQLKNRTQILGGKTRAYPALANGLFFARSTRELVCVELR
jgi:outer membrane protein assembly factor BamB